MPSKSETGHAKNLANFETLISFCNGYGADYNPSRAELQLNGLNTLRTNARNSLAEVSSAKNAFINATNARQTLFEPLKKLATRIISALNASGAGEKLVKDARTINNKIQGRRSKPKPMTDEDEVGSEKTISVSQQSYHSITENFADLVVLVSNEPAYAPNETELQPATLQTLVEELRAANIEVADAYTAYSNARIGRNQTLYDENGLEDVAANVKDYVKSLYGTSHERYKQVSTLEFKKPGKQ